ncbi:MAG: methyl-accepting chemotaxis protein [Desulfovibrio sp.]|uniref:methyl-accepting chemotaxis protein n=1 Tax=Desulfovibrio sp. 7SRBS1 TaxID=3378064 RepID=UPI003B3C1278
MVDDSDRAGNKHLKKLVHERLGRLVNGTRGIVAEQEPMVLRLGEGLHRIWSEASELSGRAGQLVDKLSGESVADGVQNLVDTLNQLNSISEDGGGGESLGYLDDILTMASSLDNYLNEFKKIVRTLLILGMTTRIESARLGSEGRGFSTLADDVEKLASNIVAHSSQIREKYAALENVVSQASAKTREITSLQESYSIEVRENIRSNLSALEAFLEGVSDRASDFAGTSSEISSQVGEAVSSMQFHDIVRQRVEHVEEAFTEMGQELDTSLKASADIAPEPLAAWMVHVCEMQSRQLQESGESFYSAIEGLKDNLLGIGASVESMCSSMAQDSSSRALDEPVDLSADECHKSPLQVIESGIKNAMSGVQAYAELETEIHTLMASVVDIVKDMAIFVDDIEEVGSEIELIAINASVRAAHTGELGAALGVLAIEIQSLSARAREHTVGVADVLNKVSSVSDTLVELDQSGRREQDMVTAIADLGKTIEGLAEANDMASQESLALISESRHLIKNIQSTTERVSFHEGIRAKLTAFSRQAEELAEAIGRAVPESAHAAIPDHLKGKLDRYTMETERDVHRSVFGHDGGEKADGGNDIELFSDDPDDNIELF